MVDLILGTAEFDPKGYAGKPVPSQREIIRILNLAYEGGIRTLDCADTYGTEEIEKYFAGFNRINKSRDLAKTDSFYHYKPGEEAKIGIKKASVYDLGQVWGLKETIIPLNINNTLFLKTSLDCSPYIRSIFDRGRLLAEGYTVKDCLSFVYRRGPKGVIVGVSSVKELDELLTAWGSLNAKH